MKGYLILFIAIIGFSCQNHDCSFYDLCEQARQENKHFCLNLNFRQDDAILDELRADPVVWGNFQTLPDLYVRVRLGNVQLYRDRPKAFKSRLDLFISDTRRGLIRGNWNDGGRLLDRSRLRSPGS